jgi:hypothetical protein
MKAVLQRLRRLEQQLAPAEWQPKDYSLLTVIRLNHASGLGNATYTAHLCANGIVMELVSLNYQTHSELSAEEWNQWLEEKRKTWKMHYCATGGDPRPTTKP